MTDSYRALCSDFYVNQKISVKLELPRTRETVLELFERVRRQYPGMSHFRRVRDELALESPQTEMPHRWLAVKPQSLRSGTVNPIALPDAYSLHRFILEAAPPYLSITPLDIEYIELLYGFDLHAGGNHDSIVLDALIPGSPLSSLLDIPGAVPIDYQPVVGLAFAHHDAEVHFEVKTRAVAGASREPTPAGGDPISVYLTVRRFGGISDTRDLDKAFTRMTELGEELIEQRLLPGILAPIREVIGSGNP
jgi:hypothetical protein